MVRLRKLLEFSNPNGFIDQRCIIECDLVQLIDADHHIFRRREITIRSADQGQSSFEKKLLQQRFQRLCIELANISIANDEPQIVRSSSKSREIRGIASKPLQSLTSQFDGIAHPALTCLPDDGGGIGDRCAAFKPLLEFYRHG